MSFNSVLLEKIWRKFLEGKTGREGQKLGTICLAGFRGGGVVRNMLSMYFVLLQKCEKYTTKMHAVAPALLKKLRLSSCNENLPQKFARSLLIDAGEAKTGPFRRRSGDGMDLGISLYSYPAGTHPQTLARYKVGLCVHVRSIASQSL